MCREDVELAEQRVDVRGFYDAHPINERQILDALRRDGLDLTKLTPGDLYAHDQDHYGGLSAVDRLAETLALGPGEQVLDVCSGMGGPARYLAHRYGVSVTGIDLTTSRTIGARRLTAMVGLGGVVFVNGDATRLPLADSRMDAALSQEAFLHIPDKTAVVREVFRVLRPGGRFAFTDWTVTEALSDADRERLALEMTASNLQSAAGYRAMLEGAGFGAVTARDLSAEWREILVQRMAMFAGMEADTVRIQGEGAHRRYMAAYAFFIDRIEAGALGGHMFAARKPQP